jgi:hypothetical protein
MSPVGVEPFNSLNQLTTVPVAGYAARATMHRHGPVPPISLMTPRMLWSLDTSSYAASLWTR